MTALAGIEPATKNLTGSCSTAELQRNKKRPEQMNGAQPQTMDTKQIYSGRSSPKKKAIDLASF